MHVHMRMDIDRSVFYITSQLVICLFVRKIRRKLSNSNLKGVRIFLQLFLRYILRSGFEIFISFDAF